MERINFKKKCLAGFCIGLAVIVPGVSGAIIAILFGLYDEIISSISSIDKNKKNILFLLPIIISAFFGLTLGFLLIKKLYFYYPFIVSCLFSGLMLGSSSNIISKIENKKCSYIIIGIAIPLILTTLSILNNTELDIINFSIKNIFMQIIIGFIISLTQFIPGASASAFLISIGIFQDLMDSLSIKIFFSNYNVMFCFIFLLVGAILGIIIISKILNKIVKSNKNVNNIYYGLAIGSAIAVFINKDNLLLYKEWIRFGFNYLELYLGIIIFLCSIVLAKWFLEKNK